MKKSWYVKQERSISFLEYYFVFCPRYKRKLFSKKNVRDRFKVILQDVCHELGISLLWLRIKNDSVAMRVLSIPELSPRKIAARIKRVSSRMLRDEFEHLQHLSSLWTLSFFVSSAPEVSDDEIKKYIDEQKIRM
jgi:putative transposase